MFKNVVSQKIALFEYDSTTGAPKTGDAANITPYVSKDYGTVTVLGTTTATEMDATNAKGWYSFVLTQAETNGDALLFTGKSSTANAFLVGQLIYTIPASYTGVGRCTVSTSSTTTSVITSACAPAGAVANQFAGRIITFDGNTTTAALQGQSATITASSNAAAPTFTVTALTTAPVSGDTFSIT